MVREQPAMVKILDPGVGVQRDVDQVTDPMAIDYDICRVALFYFPL